MPSKIMNFIEKANKVIFFVGALFLISAFSFLLLVDMLGNSYEPPTVEIVNKDTPQETLKYNKRYLRKVDEWFVFEVSAEKIKLSDNTNSFLSKFEGSARYDKSYLNGNTVNILFTNIEGKSRLLLKQPSLITDIDFIQRDPSSNSHILTKNLYTFAPKDSNQDNFLDHKDDKDFWVSNGDGTDLKRVITNINSYRVIRDNTVMIEKADEFYFYNVDKDQLVQLDTTINQL